MDYWLPFFVVVACLSIVLQTVILGAMYLQMRRTTAQMSRISEELHAKLDPLLTRVNYLLEDSRTRITSMVADWAEFSQIARNQAVKFDRVVSEGMELLRGQIVRADQILTGVLETADDASTHLRKSVLGPVTQVAAMIRGVKASLDFFSSPKRPAAERSKSPSDEELFI